MLMNVRGSVEAAHIRKNGAAVGTAFAELP
jgi:hypothetical protein